MNSVAKTSASITRQDDGVIALQGVLDFQTVPAIARQATGLLTNGDDISVDCSQVSSANSAGLALLLEMSRIMRASQQSIEFNNVPEQIQIVAHAYGLVTPEQDLESIL